MAYTNKSRWQKTRKFFNDVHLWLGLASGLIIIVVCFSGTIYTYNTELTEMAAPHLYKVEKTAPTRISPDDLLAKVELVSGGKVTALTIPADEERTYQFNTRTKDDKSRFGTVWMVNPYSGEITGNSQEKTGTKEFMGTMFSLHRWLLLDKIEKPILSSMTNRELGSMITGWATILFTLGCITGLVIWFPQKIKAWRQGLSIKWSGNWKRVNHDLHNTLAFYALFFLLLMGLTGPQWSFKWYREGLQKTLGVYKPEQKGAKPGDQATAKGNVERKGEGRIQMTGSEKDAVVKDEALRRLAIAAYIDAADKVLPYEGNYTITLPSDQGSPVNISKTKIGFFAPAAGDRISLNQHTGATVKLDIFRDKPLNERIAASIKALHVGNVYGGFTKLLYFISCLIATTLPVTGTMIWLNKLKKKRKRNKPKPVVSTIKLSPKPAGI